MKFKTNIIFSQTLSSFDWIVFFSVMLITILCALFGHKLYKKTQNNPSLKDESNSLIEFLLMGRQLTLPLFLMTLVSTWYGGIFGVTSIAFEKGIYNFVTQGFFWYIAYAIFALFLTDKIHKYQAVTLPDLIEKMFGPKSAKISAFFTLFNVLPIAYTISLGLFMQALFGGSLLLNMSYGILIVLAYAMFGGFRAIVFSDIIQFFVMCSAVAIVLFVSISTFGGIDFLTANLPATHFSLTGGESLFNVFAWGLIALSTLVDPNFYQRCFAAKSSKVAKKGILLAIIIWVLFDICTTAGAMYAKAVIPMADSKNAYLIYSLQLLPSGLKGLFLAGILATILSTLDSYLFIASNTIAYDFLPKKYHQSKIPHYMSLIFIGILSIVLALYFDGNIKSVWKTLGSYSAACLLLPVTYGYLFPKKATDNQFVFASILGVIGTTFWRHVEKAGIWQNVDDLYIGIICTSIGLLLFGFLQRAKIKSEKP